MAENERKPSYGETKASNSIDSITNGINGHFSEKSSEADKDEAVCSLTSDIICDILSRLSIEDIVRYKIVSKDWNARTKDPLFIEMHLRRSLAQPHRLLLEPKASNFDSFSSITAASVSRLCLVDCKDGVWKGREILIQNMQGNFALTMASCHGLLCVASLSYEPDPFFIYNPITRESLKLPDTVAGHSWSGSLSVGFGYDPINKKYKVVRLFRCYGDEGVKGEIITLGEALWRELEVSHSVICRYPAKGVFLDEGVKGEIITLGEALWRELEVSHSVICRYPAKGVFLDDAMHWMIDNEDGQVVGILVLDISSEKFRTIKIPLSIRRSIKDQDGVVLLNLGGFLSLVEHSQWEQFCVWRMAHANTKTGYKFYESSYKMSLNKANIWSLKMMGRMIDDSFLFHVSPTKGRKDHLSMYYPEQDRHQIIEGVGIPKYYDANFYTPTFVSLSSVFGNCDQVRRGNTDIVCEGNSDHSSEKSSEVDKNEEVCSLTPDIISDILSRLSIEDIIRYKIVNKEWNARTKDPLFIEMHLQRSLAQPQRFLLEPKANNISLSSLTVASVSRLCLVDCKDGVWKGREILIQNMQGNFALTMASCHGLLCVASLSYEPDPFFIYNPITRESLKLPDTVSGQSWMGSLSVGFGYDPINKKYKVVRLFRCYGDGSVKGEIITLGEASWRELEVSHSVICRYPAKGVFLDNAIHWMTDDDGGQIEGILILDISSEKFRTIKVPLSIRRSIKDQDDVVLLDLGGSLSLVEHSPWEQFCVWRIARVNTKTGYKFYESSYKMSLNEAKIWSMKMMGRMIDDSFLFHVSPTKGRKDHLSMYYPEQDRHRIIEGVDIPEYYDANLYTPTFVSPFSASGNSDQVRGGNSDQVRGGNSDRSSEKSSEVDKDEAVCSLTPDIISDIVSRLSIEDIIRYKIVSKEWNAWTKDPLFIEMHLQRSLAQPQRFLLEPKADDFSISGLTAASLSHLCLVDYKDGVWKGREILIQNMHGNFALILASCHGLLCVASWSYERDPLFIYNPITRESLKLPDTVVGQSWRRGAFSIGFGYDSINKKYKVVRLFRCYGDDSVKGEIITLGEASWRELKVSHSVICRYSAKGVFWDDAIHWMTDDDDGQVEGILIFDISREKFRTIKIPLSIRRSIKDQDDVALLDLGGSLSLVEHSSWEQFCVWRMARANTKTGYKFYESSYKMSLIKAKLWSVEMMGRMIDDSFLFQVIPIEGRKNLLSMYYPEQDRHRIIEGVGIPEYYDANLYTPTFVSPFAASGSSDLVTGSN